MDEPITTQSEALELWPRDKGVYLHMGMRGSQFCFVGFRPVRQRVWERLLERSDLEIRVANGYDGYLWVTEQGLARV